MQEYNICYSLDSNYAEQLAVSMASVLKNANDEDKLKSIKENLKKMYIEDSATKIYNELNKLIDRK